MSVVQEVSPNPSVPAPPLQEVSVPSSKDWDHWRAEDLQAGAAVAGLMATIFALGLVGYLIIFFICWR